MAGLPPVEDREEEHALISPGGVAPKTGEELQTHTSHTLCFFSLRIPELMDSIQSKKDTQKKKKKKLILTLAIEAGFFSLT